MTAARQARAARPDSPDHAAPDSRFLSTAGQRILETGFEAQAGAMSRAIEACRDHLGFLAQRLDRDRDFVREMAVVRNPADASAALVHFLAAAQVDYWERFQRLLDQSAKGAEAATVAAEQQVRELTKATRIAANDAETATEDRVS